MNTTNTYEFSDELTANGVRHDENQIAFCGLKRLAKLARATGIEYTGLGASGLQVQYTEVEPAETNNNTSYFTDLPDGLYQVSNLRRRSLEAYDLLFVVKAGKYAIVENAVSEALDQLPEAADAAMAIADNAAKLVAEFDKKAAALAEKSRVVADDGLIAEARITNLPASEAAQLVGRNRPAPEPRVLGFTCGVAQGQTAESAFKIVRDRAAATKAAAEETAGLRALTGTEKQVAWATTIRAAFAKTNPNSPLLKQRTAAKWWIENRNNLK